MVTKDILSQVLEKDLGVTVKDFQVEFEDGSKKGENFSCILKRVILKFKHPTNGNELSKSFMAKCVPKNAMRASWIKDVSIRKTAYFLSLSFSISIPSFPLNL